MRESGIVRNLKASIRAFYVCIHVIKTFSRRGITCNAPSQCSVIMTTMSLREEERGGVQGPGASKDTVRTIIQSKPDKRINKLIHLTARLFPSLTA